MNVPILDLRFQYDPLRQELLDAVTRVCDSQRFILGPELDAFEREIAERLEVAWAVGVSSGTDALLVSLMALGVGPQDEVVTSTYSFFASAGVIDRLGARPVLVDIDPVTYNVDVEAVRQAVTSQDQGDPPGPSLRTERSDGRPAGHCERFRGQPRGGCVPGDHPLGIVAGRLAAWALRAVSHSFQVRISERSATGAWWSRTTRSWPRP